MTLADPFTCQPVCGPARSCLQTGLYATQTGCFRNGIPLPVEARTLAHHFNDVLPDGREKAVALTKIEEAMFWANASIARQPPEDE